MIIMGDPTTRMSHFLLHLQQASRCKCTVRVLRQQISCMLKVNREGEDDHYEVDDDGNEDENHSGPGPDRQILCSGWYPYVRYQYDGKGYPIRDLSSLE